MTSSTDLACLNQRYYTFLMRRGISQSNTVRSVPSKITSLLVILTMYRPAGAAFAHEYNPLYQPLYPSTHPRHGRALDEVLPARDNLTDVHLERVGVLFGARPDIDDQRRYTTLCRRINEQDRTIRVLQNNVAVLLRASEVNDRRMINLLHSVMPPELVSLYFPLSARARELRRLVEFDVLALQRQVTSLEQRVEAAEATAERATRLAEHGSFRHPIVSNILASEPNPTNENSEMLEITLERGFEDDDVLFTQGTVAPSERAHLLLRARTIAQGRSQTLTGGSFDTSGYPNAEPSAWLSPHHTEDNGTWRGETYWQVGDDPQGFVRYDQLSDFVLGQSFFSTSIREQARAGGDEYQGEEESSSSDSSEPDGAINPIFYRYPGTQGPYRGEDRHHWNRTGAMVSPGLRRRNRRRLTNSSHP